MQSSKRLDSTELTADQWAKIRWWLEHNLEVKTKDEIRNALAACLHRKSCGDVLLLLAVNKYGTEHQQLLVTLK